MKRTILIIFSICNIFFVSAQQENIGDDELHRMGQDLVNYLENNRYFEARELYDSIKVKTNKIDPVVENYYRFYVQFFENQPDSVVFYGQQIIKDGIVEGEIALAVYYDLCQICANVLHDYEKSLNLCDSAKMYIDKNPELFDDNTIQQHKEIFLDVENQTKRRSMEPVIRMVRDNTQNSVPFVSDSIMGDYIQFGISYNNHNNIRTIFDTGVTEFFFMDKDEAAKLGVRRYHIYDNDTIVTINGVQTSGYKGILDSLRIANIKMYNVPVIVFDFSLLFNLDTMNIESAEKEKVNSFRESLKIFMGLKAMNLIGKFVLDYDNKEIYFPINDSNKSHINKKKNMYIVFDRLYTKVAVNKLPLTVHIDTGSNDYFVIDSGFFERNKEYISVDTIKEKFGTAMMHKIRIDSSKIIVMNPYITFDNRSIEPVDTIGISSLYHWNKSHIGIEDGVIGYPFIKSFGKKVLFDFRNMRIEALKED